MLRDLTGSGLRRDGRGLTQSPQNGRFSASIGPSNASVDLSDLWGLTLALRKIQSRYPGGRRTGGEATRMAAFAQHPRALQEQASRPLWDSVFATELCALHTIWHADTPLDREHGIDAEALLHTGQALTIQAKTLSHDCLKYGGTLTIEYASDASGDTYKLGDWDTCKALLYVVGYLSETGAAFDDYVIVNMVTLKILTMLGKVRWQSRINTKDGARASFKFTPVADLPESCIVARKGFGLPSLGVLKSCRYV